MHRSAYCMHTYQDKHCKPLWKCSLSTYATCTNAYCRTNSCGKYIACAHAKTWEYEHTHFDITRRSQRSHLLHAWPLPQALKLDSETALHTYVLAHVWTHARDWFRVSNWKFAYVFPYWVRAGGREGRPGGDIGLWSSWKTKKWEKSLSFTSPEKDCLYMYWWSLYMGSM